LNSHLKSHFAYKAFSCGECKKTFKWRHDLQKHQSRFHDGKGAGRKPTKQLNKESPMPSLPSHLSEHSNAPLLYLNQHTTKHLHEHSVASTPPLSPRMSSNHSPWLGNPSNFTLESHQLPPLDSLYNQPTYTHPSYSQNSSFLQSLYQQEDNFVDFTPLASQQHLSYWGFFVFSTPNNIQHCWKWS
jgi:hypothetical protein